jgi:hypothetical protein
MESLSGEARAMNHGIRIIPKAIRKYRSKRARRQAFYASAKVARLLTRLVVEIEPDALAADESAMTDALVHGTGWVKITTTIADENRRAREAGMPFEPLWVMPYRWVDRAELERLFPARTEEA